MRDVGGTPGGLPLFGLGLGMAAGGAYLLTNQVIVHSGYWGFWGARTFGLTLLPLLFGIGFLFWTRARRLAGRSASSGPCSSSRILVNLFEIVCSTSLFNTLIMLTLLVGGLGLVARSLWPMRA